MLIRRQLAAFGCNLSDGWQFYLCSWRSRFSLLISGLPKSHTNLVSRKCPTLQSAPQRALVRRDCWTRNLPNLLVVTSADTHEEMFLNITKSLQQSHPTGISAVVQEHPWIFINAGGWMGAYSLLYSSLSEYVLLFGTPIGSGGHSGRYWAHIEDTTITGTFHQWPEGSTRKKTYGPSSTVVHRRWEATNVYWEADTWMVEYARGFIPSAMPFALADSLFSAQDVLSIWKSVKMYGQEVVRNMWSGRF
eukprot:gb/GECG01010410.1/.p1 GENE.gb/GECG01010410.1/~~gb/GECG01010410.1/.p1  ORF type:complete len:248 (+),score=17.48 gb/GECG01010410.1/:1-744(+)